MYDSTTVKVCTWDQWEEVVEVEGGELQIA